MNSYQRIKEVMKELVKQKPFEAITVTMICQDAYISRKTFYTFYHDKYDVIEKIVVDDIIEKCYRILDLTKGFQVDETMIVEKMYQCFYNDQEFYAKAINIEGGNLLKNCLLCCFEEFNLNMFEKTRVSLIEKEYAAYFFAASQVALIEKWIVDGFVLTPKKLAKQYQKWAYDSYIHNYLKK